MTNHPRLFPEEPVKIWTVRRELDVIRPPILPLAVSIGSMIAVVVALAVAFLGGL